MDVGIGAVPRILCGCDGSMGLRPTLALRPTAAFHGCLLWIHISYILLRSWGESLLRLYMLSCAQQGAISTELLADKTRLSQTAPQHHPHHVFSYCTNCLSCLVPRQLLPHGLQRPACRLELRRKESCRLGDRMSRKRVGTTLSLGADTSFQTSRGRMWSWSHNLLHGLCCHQAGSTRAAGHEGEV